MTEQSGATPTYRVPGPAPRTTCNDRNTTLNEHHGLRCNRRQGHSGRHAYILWGLNGLVRAVWVNDEPETRMAA